MTIEDTAELGGMYIKLQGLDAELQCLDNLLFLVIWMASSAAVLSLVL